MMLSSKMKLSVLLVFTATLFVTSSASSQNIICYFTSWTVYRPGNGMYNVSNIPPDLCTHIYYSFVGLNVDGSVNNMDPWETFGLHEFKHLINLRKRNPSLKIVLSMGGWNEGSRKYSTVAADPNLRTALANNIIEFLRKNKFDGFDLDWEYPAQRGGSDSDVENFIILLKELNQALKAQPEKFSLSVAVSGGVLSEDISYDFKGLAEAVDFINVMTYDYHGDWETYTGHYAPLRASHLDTDDNALLNVVSGFSHWIQNGVPPSKLNLGLGTYGRTFTLRDPTNQGLYAPVTGTGKMGPYSEEAGMIGFNEICEFYPPQNQNVVFDEEQEVPHMVVDTDQWIGYDDVESIRAKTKYAKQVGAAGVFVWSLDTDDFLNKCGLGAYPLIRTMKSAWDEY